MILIKGMFPIIASKLRAKVKSAAQTAKNEDKKQSQSQKVSAYARHNPTVI